MKNKMLVIMVLLAVSLLSVSAVQAGCSDGICCDKELWAKLSENEVHIARANNIEYEMEVLVISEANNEAKFKINGELTDALAEGEEDTLADGSVIEVKKILSENGVSKVIICFDYGSMQHDKSIDIAEITPASQKKYSPGQEITFKIKATENFDDGIASSYEGLHIQFYTFDATEFTEDQMLQGAGIPGDYIPVEIVKEYNADFTNPYWTATFTVPQEPGKYYTLFILYCSKDQSICGHDTVLRGAHSKHLIKYEVDGETNQYKPKTPETSPTEKKIDLSNFPELFIKGKNLNGIFVVGDQAPADDVIAAIDISMSFQKYGVSKTGDAMLASEVDHYKRNIISVGRPCDNPVTAQILRANGISDYDFDCSYGLKPGQAVVYLFDYNGYAHMLVFGYSRLETRQAARVLTFQKLKGNKQVLTFDEGSMPRPEEPANEYPEEISPDVSEPASTEKEKPEQKEPQIIEDSKKDCPGCRKNGACMQIGIRLLEADEPVYCDIDHAFKPQLENGKGCMNNYECLSNTCQDGVCQSMGEQIKGIQKELEEQKSILEKIMGFFKSIFGFS